MEREIRPRLLESDCQNLILALNGRLEKDPQTMMIIKDILSMANNQDCPAFIFFGRETNCTTHRLTHFGTELGFVKIWVGEVPPRCNNDFVNDVWRQPSLLMK
ncbi:hypothetical protein ACS0TY_005938 [Phlomoides rotata]